MTASQQEIWEATTGGTTYVSVRDPRNPDGWTGRKVGGKGSKRITLTADEREFNQSLVQYENQHLDPFTNGLLVRIAPAEGERGENEKTDEQLVALLQIQDDDMFQAILDSTKSEVIVRRMLALAERNASMMRYEAIRNVVDERYRVGKTSLVVRELQADDARYSDADL